MKTIIYYYSQCGHTKRYAEDLQVRIGGELASIKRLSRKKIKESDNIIFGGPLRNNVILKLNKLMKHYKLFKDKNIFIFTDGVSLVRVDEDIKNLIIISNDLDEKHVRLYFLPGGIDLELMHPVKRFFFKRVIAFSSKKNSDNPNMSSLASLLSHPIDFVNPSNLDRMVEVFNKVNKGKINE